MSFTQPISRLVSDQTGHARLDFLGSTPEEWAFMHMQLRYGSCRPQDPGHRIQARCWENLLEEYNILRGWFSPDGTLSVMLSTAQNPFRSTGALGDGLGWDFKASGDPSLQVIQTKTLLIAAERLALTVAPEKRNASDIIFSQVIRSVRSAYTTRASAHTWRGTLPRRGEKTPASTISGGDMAQRWTAYQTYVFLLQVGCEPSWAWRASKCETYLGCVDEIAMSSTDEP